MRFRLLLLFPCLWLVLAHAAFAQTNNVGIGTTNPHPSAILDVAANDQGVLLPRLSDAQEGGISAPLNGLLYFNTSQNVFRYWRNDNYVSLLYRQADGRIDLDVLGGTNQTATSVLDFGTNGLSLPDGVPGWKLRLLGSGPLNDGSSYGFGVGSGSLWYATGNAPGTIHQWFHGTTETMRLGPDGRLIPTGGIFARSGAPGGGGVNNNGYAFIGSTGGTDEGVFSLQDNEVNIFTNATERVRFAGSRTTFFGGVQARGGEPGPNGNNNNGYTFSGNGGDTDSGLFSTADGEVSMYTNGTERLEVTDNTVDLKTNLSSGGFVPIRIRRYENLGDDIFRDTGVSTSEFNAAIVGFRANSGDIQENGVGDIIDLTMVDDDGTWHIRADFRSHNTGENWGVDVMFIHKYISDRNY